MRAHGRKYEMGRRFAILIGLAATGVMALGAQTGAAASEGVVEYDSKVTIRWQSSIPRDWSCTPAPAAGRTPCVPGRFVRELWHGNVYSERGLTPHGLPTKQGTKCMYGRQVILFRKRPGPDRKLGATRSTPDDTNGFYNGVWKVRAPERGRVYAKVTPKVGDGFVCLADYSHVILNGGS